MTTILTRPEFKVPTIHLEGVPVSRLGFAETLSLLTDWLHDETGSHHSRRVATANADFLYRARHDEQLREALRTADLVTADGWPLVAASRFRGEEIAERVAGSDLLVPLCAAASMANRSVFLLGGQDGVAAAAAKVLQESFADLWIAGTAEPFIRLDDEVGCARVAREVADSGAALLIVALGCPKQELFLHRWLAHTGCSLGIGVGASLDFLVGRSKRAPGWAQKLHLEWLHRALSEPGRLGSRYAKNLPFVLGMLWREWWRRGS